MGKLNELNITIAKDIKAESIFEGLFPSFLELEYKKPSEYVQKYWSAYSLHPQSNNNVNGKVFEYILATLCVREGILPIYINAKVAFVPNVIYDLMFYAKKTGPVCWSFKTSLRERYKQADLEAIALKQVHRKALSYLITLNEKEAKSVKTKINNGDITGLNNVVVATSEEFNELIAEMKKMEFSQPPTVKVFECNQIITKEKVSRIRR